MSGNHHWKRMSQMSVTYTLSLRKLCCTFLTLTLNCTLYDSVHTVQEKVVLSCHTWVTLEVNDFRLYLQRLPLRQQHRSRDSNLIEEGSISPWHVSSHKIGPVDCIHDDMGIWRRSLWLRLWLIGWDGSVDYTGVYDATAQPACSCSIKHTSHIAAVRSM